MTSPLLAYRRKHRLSQDEVADQLEVSRSMVSLWEKGHRTITAEMAVKIEERLGINRVLFRPDIFRKRAA